MATDCLTVGTSLELRAILNLAKALGPELFCTTSFQRASFRPLEHHVHASSNFVLDVIASNQPNGLHDLEAVAAGRQHTEDFLAGT